jgi:hypothetical protein
MTPEPVSGNVDWLIEPVGGGCSLIIEEGTIKAPFGASREVFVQPPRHRKDLLFTIGTAIEQSVRPKSEGSSELS